MYWELRCYKTAESPTIMGVTYSCPVGSYRLYYKLQGWYGVTIGSKVLLTSGNGDDAGGYVRFRNGTSNLWSMTGQGFNYAGKCPRWPDNSPANSWYDVSDAEWGNYSVYPEGLITVSSGTTLSLNLTYNITLRYNTQYSRNVSKTSSSTSVSVSGGSFLINTVTSPVGCSAWFTKDGTTVPSGSYVFLGDTLVYHYSVQTGYEITSHKVNGITRADGYSFTVTSGMSSTLIASAECVVQSFLLSLSTTTGIALTITRTSSPKQGASTGVLSNGATIYYSDVLQIVFTVSVGYNVTTHTINGSEAALDSSMAVNSAVTVVAAAALKTFLLDLDLDSGSIAVVTRTYSPIGNATLGQLSDGDTLYYSDVIEISTSARPGYVFQGATLNGSQISSPYSVTQDVTIVVVTIAAGGYIGTGTAFDLYQFLIRSQQDWDLYRIVIKSSQGWDTY